MEFPLKKKKILIGIIIVVLVIFLSNFFQKGVRSFFYSFSAPIQRVFWRAGDRTADFFEAFIRVKKLKKEVDELKLKNQELLSRVAALKELEGENKLLREALGIELQKDFKLLLSQIIGKDVSQDFILIDKGREDGVLENMPVITQQKVLLGKTIEVYNNFSKVMLIFNKNSSFDVKIQEKDISGVVKGKGNFKISLDLIPQDKETSQGDIVVTSKLGGIFPSGLLVGKIKEVKKSDIEPFQVIEIESTFNLEEINYLFVIKEY